MTKIYEIPFLIGYTVKPLLVSETGIVLFTDGTNDVLPNQQQCEAYGYTYDKETGTCSSYKFNTNLDKNISNTQNNIKGSKNTTIAGTNNTYIMGEDNTVRGLSRNNIIAGNNNEIQNSINNTMVFGTLGESTADNSIVLGGNNGATDNLGERQSIQVMFGRTSTQGTNIASYMNNTTSSYFPIPLNTALYFHSDVIAVRVGGSAGAGSVGDFASWVERGVVINKSGTATISRERDSIKSSGSVTGWQPTGIVVSGTTSFSLRVRGATDMTIEWAATVNFTQIKTGVAL